MFLPDYPERISSVAPGGSFSRAVVGRCPIRVWGGPVEPATVAKVEAPRNGRVRGWACLGSNDPALVPEAPIGLIKKDSTKAKAERPFQHVFLVITF